VQKVKTARTAAVLLTALLLVLFFSPVPGRAVDASRPVTLTVGVEDAGTAGGPAAAAVEIDVYRVARAVSDGGDGLTLEALPPYGDLDLSSAADRGSLRLLTDAALEIALRSGSPAVAGAALGTKISRADDGTALGAGMYLVVPHGAGLDPAGYLCRVADETGAVHTATAAYSDYSRYLFQPQLLTLPIRAAELASGLYDCDVAAGGEAVIYDASISFKYEEDPLEGSLLLTKRLLSHAEGTAATFVFSVDVRRGGSLVFSDIRTLTFDAAGEKTLRIDGLPAGAEVTVTEVYSGAGYKLVSAPSVTAVVAANAPAEARFVNEFDYTDRDGGSIVNHLSYSGGTGWSWQTLPEAEG
jgi:hypothetical protein